MARTIKLSRVVPQTLDSHDAYHRAQARAQDLDIALTDPQVGPVEVRGPAIQRDGREK